METPIDVNDAFNKGYDPHSTGGNTFWNKTEFDGAINDRGYNCTTEKAIKCPCVNLATGSALPSCQNCGGTSWVYIDKKNKVKVLLQSMAYSEKYFNWTQANTATARATIWDIEKLVYMDKVTLDDASTNYSQHIRLQEYDNKLFGFTTYPVEKVLGIYAFLSPTDPLMLLIENTDFYFDKGKNILFFNEKVLSLDNKTMTVHYTHKPQYIVIDILRDIIQQKVVRVGDSAPKLENLPNSYIMRRLHFALNINYLGNSILLDNG